MKIIENTQKILRVVMIEVQGVPRVWNELVGQVHYGVFFTETR